MLRPTPKGPQGGATAVKLGAGLHLPSALAATSTKTLVAAASLVGIATAATVSVIVVGSNAVVLAGIATAGGGLVLRLDTPIGRRQPADRRPQAVTRQRASPPRRRVRLRPQPRLRRPPLVPDAVGSTSGTGTQLSSPGTGSSGSGSAGSGSAGAGSRPTSGSKPVTDHDRRAVAGQGAAGQGRPCHRSRLWSRRSSSRR